jgi:CBS domain-containing protein
MKVGDLMSPDIEVVAPDETLKAAAELMAELGSDVLPVGQDNRLIGTITGYDIALRVVAQCRDPEKITVGEAMSSDVLYCFANESARIVSDKMSGWWVRRLPVVGPDKRLLGTVSLGDLTPLKAASRRSRRARAQAAACSKNSVRMAAA